MPMVKEKDAFEFVPTKWIGQYLSDPTSATTIETSGLLCVHGNMDVDRLNEVKAVDKEAVSWAFLLSVWSAWWHHFRRRTCFTPTLAIRNRSV
jgi:hypothetical protein